GVFSFRRLACFSAVVDLDRLRWIIALVSRAAAQRRQNLEAGIAVRGRKTTPLLEITHRAHRIGADTAIDAAGVESERSQPLLDFLHFGKRRRTWLATGKLLAEWPCAFNPVAKIGNGQGVIE